MNMDNRPDQLNIYRYKKVKNLPVYVVISYLVLVALCIWTFWMDYIFSGLILWIADFLSVIFCNWV